MKMLVIDIGNSNIKCGIIENCEILEVWRYATTDASRCGKELRAKAEDLPVIMCSVVPPAAELIEQSFRKPDAKVSIDAQSEIEGFYAGFGADRIADAVGARLLYGKGKNVVVVGLGTGTVLTAISADGKFSGGLITLGVTATAQALSSRIPQLPAISLDANKPASLGASTIDSMTSGILLAHQGTLVRWIEHAKSALAGPTVTVATGGWAERVDKELKLFDHVDTSLTLKGAYLIGSTALKQHSVK